MSDSVETVKDEALRQTVILVFSVLGVLATVGTMDYLNSPDAWRTFKMSTALWVKRFCQNESDRWQEWADHAATAYNREKL